MLLINMTDECVAEDRLTTRENVFNLSQSMYVRIR